MSENLVSRDEFSRPVPRQPAHLHTQAEFGAYLRDSSRVPRWRPFIYFKLPYTIGSVPSLSGHAIAYRRSLPRVRRHRTSKSQGSSERVLPWQVNMDQLICASLSHPHFWYEVGMLKVPCSRETPKKHSFLLNASRICTKWLLFEYRIAKMKFHNCITWLKWYNYYFQIVTLRSCKLNARQTRTKVGIDLCPIPNASRENRIGTCWSSRG